MLNGLTTRVIGGLTSYGVPRGAAPFNPRSLFAAGEQGAIYDPSDFSTMYQDAAGTTPVTAVEQYVGLMLDKSKGLALGPELVTNGLTGFTDVNGSHTATSFTIMVTGGVTKSVFSVGKTYKVTVAGSVTSGTFSVNTADGLTPTSRTQFMSGFGTCYINANTPYLYLRLDAAGTASNITLSVREIAGNHTYQTTSASRPQLKALTNGNKDVYYDGVDDSLKTTFASSLGSACTIARGVAGSDPVILAGQTIGTTYTNTASNTGLIIINRALSDSETIKLTNYLKARS